jgi:uncharacterized protein (DUF169 family)
MPQKSTYAQLSSTLSETLQLRQAPVAVSFAGSLPPGVFAHEGRVAAGCRFWEDAASGAFATDAADHGMCAIGVHTHNLAPSPAQQADLMDALKVFADLGYVRPEEVAAIPVLASRPDYVVYAPLSDTPLPPDVVLLFVSARQTLILAEAAQQVETDTPPAMGRPACAVIPQVMNTGRAALSLGCCGARAYLDVLGDDVAIFAIPGAKIETYVQRIESLVGANGILSTFHQQRRRDVEQGSTPTIRESLAAMGA